MSADERGLELVGAAAFFFGHNSEQRVVSLGECDQKWVGTLSGPFEAAAKMKPTSKSESCYLQRLLRPHPISQG